MDDNKTDIDCLEECIEAVMERVKLIKNNYIWLKMDNKVLRKENLKLKAKLSDNVQKKEFISMSKGVNDNSDSKIQILEDKCEEQKCLIDLYLEEIHQLNEEIIALKSNYESRENIQGSLKRPALVTDKIMKDTSNSRNKIKFCHPSFESKGQEKSKTKRRDKQHNFRWSPLDVSVETRVDSAEFVRRERKKKKLYCSDQDTIDLSTEVD